MDIKFKGVGVNVRPTGTYLIKLERLKGKEIDILLTLLFRVFLNNINLFYYVSQIVTQTVYPSSVLYRR